MATKPNFQPVLENTEWFSVWKQSWFFPTVIIVLCALVYSNSLRSPFFFDDAGAVVNNSTIRDLRSWNIFVPPPDGSTTTGRPIVNASLALNYALSGEAVWSYHVTNLIIHVGSALLLYGIARRCLQSSTFNDRFVSSSDLFAFGIASVWSVHPLNTESVVCIAQRTECLAGLFYLAALYCFTRGARADGESKGWLVVSALLIGIGMGTKEILVTAPVMMLLYDRTFVTGSFTGGLKKRAGTYVLLASTWLILGLLLAKGGGARGASAGFGLGVSSWHYFLRQAEAIILYLKLCFWPNPLVVDYGTAVSKGVAEVWWQGALVLTLVASTIWALIRRPAIGFLGAWFFVILAPSSSVVPLVTQTMAEHRMYLPVASVVGAAITLAYVYLRLAAPYIVAVLVCVLGATTWIRNLDYHDTLKIWSMTAADYPQNARAHDNLALELQKRGRVSEAYQEYATAVALQPNYALAYYNWGVALLSEGHVGEAIQKLKISVRIAPEHADAHLNLGIAFAQDHQMENAIQEFETLLRLQPDAVDGHYNIALALMTIDRIADAKQHLLTAIDKRPTFAAAYLPLARLAEREGQWEQALRFYEKSITLTPGDSDAQAGFGVLLARMNRLSEAETHLVTAVRLRPQDPNLLSNLGNVYLLEGRARDAIDQYEASLRIRPDDQQTAENLSVAREAVTSGGRRD